MRIRGRTKSYAAVNSGIASICGLQTSIVRAGVMTQLSRSAGNWRVNVCPVVCIVNCTIRRRSVCVIFFSPTEAELSPELYIRTLCSYN